MNVNHHLYNVMLDYTNTHIICDKCKLYHVALFYVITTTCIYAAFMQKILCHIYMHSLSKYGIITLTVETF